MGAYGVLLHPFVQFLRAKLPFHSKFDTGADAQAVSGHDASYLPVELLQKATYQAVSTDVIQQKLESCLSNKNRCLSDYAKKLNLEYSDSPSGWILGELTSVADTPERPVPVSEIGSGENLVGYHIVAHLALHTWLANRHRPVPSFLLLDQLSLAQFSPDSVPRHGVTQEKLDSHRRAVKGLFGLIFDVVERLDRKFQVIITDQLISATKLASTRRCVSAGGMA